MNMVLLKNIFAYLIYITLVNFVQPKSIRNYQETIIPRIYAIVEKNNKILLRNTESQEFNKHGLLNYLQENANLEYRVNNIFNREKIPVGAKKRWIKRVVPHAQKTLDVTYDKNNGLLFKPFIRIQKTKNVNFENKNSIPKLSKVRSELNKLYTSYSLEAIRNSVKHEPSHTKEIGHLIQHLREVDHIIGGVDSSRLKHNLHDILKNHHAKIAMNIEIMHREVLNHLTRALKRQLRGGGGAPKIEDVCKGEECYTVKPLKPAIQISGGVTIQPPESEETASEIPCALFPHQPLWNEWTGRQTLYQDVCPPGQAKILNICAKIPPH